MFFFFFFKTFFGYQNLSEINPKIAKFVEFALQNFLYTEIEKIYISIL